MGLKMPKTRKRSRAAANSPTLVDISGDANGRFVKSPLLFLWFYELIKTIHDSTSFSPSTSSNRILERLALISTDSIFQEFHAP